MEDAFKEFEKEAYRQTETPYQERSVLQRSEKGQDSLKKIDAYMVNNIESQKDAVKNDPRAKKFRGDATSRQATAEQQFHDSVDPGKAMKDFAVGGGEPTMNSLDEEIGYPAESSPSRQNYWDSPTDDGEGAQLEGEEKADKDPRKDTNEEEPTPETPAKTPGTSAPEGEATDSPGLAKGLSEVGETAGDLATDGSAVASVAEAAAPAIEIAEAGAVAPELLLAIVVIFIVVLVALILLVGLMSAFGSPSDGTNGGKPTVICIDPGHPAENNATGASAPDGTSETHMNWMIATDLQAALQAKGYSVVKTKDSENQYVTNKDRVDKCAVAGAVFDYRIHMDSAGSGIPGPWHEVPGPGYTNVHATSLSYAQAIQNSLTKALGVTGKKSGAQPIDGGVVNDTKVLEGSKEADIKKIPVALIEMMTMDNVNISWLKNDTNRSKFVRGIVDGIASVIPASTTSGTSGEAASIVKKAIEYKDNLPLYQTQMVKSITDCWGFAATTLKYSADPQVVYNMTAANAPVQYFNKHPEKYVEIYPVTSTSQLLPGDLLFETRGGSHAQVWVGKNAGGCAGGVISASLNSHPPQCSNWYSAMATAERVK